jgi:hypothetical protein
VGRPGWLSRWDLFEERLPRTQETDNNIASECYTKRRRVAGPATTSELLVWAANVCVLVSCISCVSSIKTPNTKAVVCMKGPEHWQISCIKCPGHERGVVTILTSRRSGAFRTTACPELLVTASEWCPTSSLLSPRASNTRFRVSRNAKTEPKGDSLFRNFITCLLSCEDRIIVWPSQRAANHDVVVGLLSVFEICLRSF